MSRKIIHYAHNVVGINRLLVNECIHNQLLLLLAVHTICVGSVTQHWQTLLPINRIELRKAQVVLIFLVLTINVRLTVTSWFDEITCDI